MTSHEDTPRSAEKDAAELAVLREFWHTFWEEVTTVDCACGLSAYEHEDMSRLEIAQDKVATFYERQTAEMPPDHASPEFWRATERYVIPPANGDQGGAA